MQIHMPDPAYTGSALARANFRLAVKISFGFVGLLWLIALLGWGLELQRVRHCAARMGGPARHPGGAAAARRLHSPDRQLAAAAGALHRDAASLSARAPSRCCRRSPRSRHRGLAVRARRRPRRRQRSRLRDGQLHLRGRVASGATGARSPRRCSSRSCTARWHGACCRSSPASPGRPISRPR